MSVLTDIIDRSRTGASRKEDDALIYDGIFEEHAYRIIRSEKYREMEYDICTNGNNPGIIIKDTHNRVLHNDISVFIDSNGVERMICTLWNYYMCYYDNHDDYSYLSRKGYKQTMSSLERDARKIIDIIKG